jgi:hypothetical protein
MNSEVSVHGHLILLFGVCVSTGHHGGRTWKEGLLPQGSQYAKRKRRRDWYLFQGHIPSVTQNSSIRLYLPKVLPPPKGATG